MCVVCFTSRTFLNYQYNWTSWFYYYNICILLLRFLCTVLRDTAKQYCWYFSHLIPAAPVTCLHVLPWLVIAVILKVYRPVHRRYTLLLPGTQKIPLCYLWHCWCLVLHVEVEGGRCLAVLDEVSRVQRHVLVQHFRTLKQTPSQWMVGESVVGQWHRCVCVCVCVGVCVHVWVCAWVCVCACMRTCVVLSITQGL